jgi:hypothetical protein
LSLHFQLLPFSDKHFHNVVIQQVSVEALSQPIATRDNVPNAGINIPQPTTTLPSSSAPNFDEINMKQTRIFSTDFTIL